MKRAEAGVFERSGIPRGPSVRPSSREPWLRGFTAAKRTRQEYPRVLPALLPVTPIEESVEESQASAHRRTAATVEQVAAASVTTPRSEFDEVRTVAVASAVIPNMPVQVTPSWSPTPR